MKDFRASVTTAAACAAALVVLVSAHFPTVAARVADAGDRGAGTGAQAGRQGFDAARLARLDGVLTAAIADHEMPGAVVVVGRGDEVVYEKAFGSRAIEPAVEPMTTDTIFDLASLTKVVATTTAVMQLVENGQVRLNDPVAKFIPEFGKYGKARISIQALLTHTSGLRPDLDLGDPWVGYDEAIALAAEEVPAPNPGFVYSDINFFLLAEVVSRVSGEPFDAYVQTHIFQPLGMRDTTFKPAASLIPRIAPTQRCTMYGWPCEGPDMRMLRGVVHDPTARRMGGVAGHAGLFSTAADLTIFARMLLDGGAVNGARVLAPLTIARMTSPATPAGVDAVRGLGWDIDSAYSSNRGEFLPLGSFGHTGFTGTSIWVDPITRVFVIFLSSRVHPDGRGDVTPVRAKVASVVASSLVDVPDEALRRAEWSRRVARPSAPPPTPREPVLAGIDVLRRDGFAALRGRRIGLLTNHTGVARDGTTTIDLLADAPGVTLVALFSPEHGIRGILDASVPSTRDEKTGLPIHSLYGDTRRPTPEMLQGLDTIVVDLQDVGARFYTYVTTVAYVMEEAASRGIKVVVLDRPNPIGGVQVEGPALDEAATSFIGYLPAMPIRHGMTIGEIARLFNGEKGIGADLEVVGLRGWRRDDWFDETGLRWINPSPNMRNLWEAALYPGIGAFEGSNVSVGRGTDTPFEQVGAPWIDGARLADALNARSLPGVSFYPVTFTPTASKFAGEACGGVFMVVTDRDVLRPVRVGVEIASALMTLFPGQFEIEASSGLFGSAAGIARIRAGDDPASVAASWSGAEARWRRIRAKYLLY
ncbi:MAG: DUF1343 domain-containing protein [Vicinamibacterales bacterium]